ncbi:MAG TPA: TQO small subunit DoxD [Tepidisphaeraceae bacterium]|nr:TQO small subunit DoxD [Tepidisphaeraceae bacterium]
MIENTTTLEGREGHHPRTVGVIAAAGSLALLRALSSYSWLSGALVGKDAKFNPGFLNGSGLAQRITKPATGFAHTALTDGVASFLTGTVVPHASLFAWMIALSELAIGLSLLFGIFARLGGLVAIIRAITNVLVAGSAADVVGHNYMLALAGLVVMLSAAGRAYGIDKLLVNRFPDSRFLRLVS